MKRIISILTTLLLSGHFFAQAPDSFKYQAVLRDGSSTILNNQSVGVRMTIQQGAIGGTAVYSETFSTTTNAYGLVNLEIGNGTVTSGTFSTINWAEGPYFIETAVDVSGGTNYVVMGTSQLLSVPYALYAKTSGSSIPGPQGPQGIQGPAGNDGAQGVQGPAGTNGLSAYEMAAANGFIGTETEWLASLEGPQGPQGIQGQAGSDGAQGPQGIQGVPGIAGSNGLSAYEVAVANGFVGTEAEWLASLEGAQGPQGIQGPAGNDGAQGPQGIQGPAGNDGAQGPQGIQGETGLLTSGSGAGNTPYWDGTNWVVNSSNIHNNGGSVGIGTTNPNSASKLEVSSNTQGFLPPRMTSTQRDAIANPVDGLMIFNTSSGCPNYYFNGSWYEWCGTSTLPLATLTGLDCGSVVFAGNLLMGVPASGVTSTLSYTGGNGGTYLLQNLPSSGVNGLTASLNGGVLANGPGSLVYAISGSPDNSGTATFSISLGGQSCSFSVNVGLPAPVIVSSTPASPSNSSTTPTLVLTGPANKTIDLYDNATGSGTPIASFSTDGSGNASIQVVVPSNSSATFVAIASDGLGNVSALSNTFTYVHNSIPQATPTIQSVSPMSPSNLSTTPTLLVSGDPGSLIQIFKSGSCTGPVVATATVGGGGTVSIPVSVTSNSSTIFTANATDAAGNVSACSNSVTYVHDNVSPTAPTIVSSSPISPSSSSVTPTLTISGEPGSLIRLYKDGSCTGPVVATATVGGGGTVAIPVTVTSNSLTTFTANATDAAGNVSVCSVGFTYVHDAIPPAAPVITGSNPTSPNNSSTTPSLNVTAVTGSIIYIYSGPSCGGSPINGGALATAPGVANIGITVNANSTSNFTAVARDAAGNQSACSNSFSYTHDVIAPSGPVPVSTMPLSPGISSTPTINFTAEPESVVRLYTDAQCVTSVGTPTTTSALGNVSLTASVAANSTTVFYANSTDASGNVSPCSSGITYVSDLVAPLAPTITSSTPASPSASTTTPLLNISNPEVGTDILIYSGNSCSGAAISTITNAGAAVSATVSVNANSTSIFTARSRDAAGNMSACSPSISYTHDSSPPASPLIFESIPSSPGDAINPLIKVSCEPYSTVTIYPNATGAGAPIATGTSSASGEVWFGPYFNLVLNNLITVNNGSINKFTAKATDQCGNVSAASSIYYYDHIFDNTAPGSTVISSNPTSPGNSTTPQLIIFCEPGAKVNLYNNLTATGSPIETYYDTDYDGDVTIQVTVLNNSTNQYSVKQTDPSGNVSASFSTYTYVHTP